MPQDLPKLMRMTSPNELIGTAGDNLIQILKENKVNGIGRIYSQWPEIEPTEGNFAPYFSTKLRPALNKTEEADMWAWGYLPTRYMPTWFMAKFPDCYLISGSGTAFRYILSPWFVETGQADTYLKQYFDAMINEYQKHRNLNCVVLEWMIFQLYTGENYFRCHDPYAIASYQNFFNTSTLPPTDYTDYTNKVNADSTFADRFDKWYKNASIRTADKYLSWIGDKIKYKVLCIPQNSNIIDNIVKGLTEYQVKTCMDVLAKYNNTMVDYERSGHGELSLINQNKSWARERNLLFTIEPDTNNGDLQIITAAIDEFFQTDTDVLSYINSSAPVETPEIWTQLRRITDIYQTIPPSEYFKTSQSSIGPIIIAGLLLGTLYIMNKNRKNKR